MKRPFVPIAALVTASVFAACAFDRSRSVTAPSSTGVPNSSSPLVGVWTSQDFMQTLPNPNMCGNFRYQITSQTSTSISGSFTATCGNGLTVTADASGQLNGNTIAITLTGTGSIAGFPSCNFTVSGNGTIEDNGNTLRIPYTGTTCLGPVSGTELLRKPQPRSPTPPTPPPPPEPPPPPPPPPSGSTDALDLRQAVITGGSPADVAYWPVTAKITALDFRDNGVRVDFTRKDGPNRWPDVVPPGWDGPIQYTLWMVVNIGGRWYTSGGVEYWYGLDRQGGPPSQFGYNWYYNPQVWGPLANRQPASGEQVGFFVTSGDQRVKDASRIHERSQVVVIPFPTGGGYFTFSVGRTE